MLFWTILKVSLKSLMANKLRSFLAMLGIIIGVGAVISMLALGAGARQQMMARISSMGTNLLIIRPGDRRFRGGGERHLRKPHTDRCPGDHHQNTGNLSNVAGGQGQCPTQIFQ